MGEKPKINGTDIIKLEKYDVCGIVMWNYHAKACVFSVKNLTEI